MEAKLTGALVQELQTQRISFVVLAIAVGTPLEIIESSTFCDITTPSGRALKVRALNRVENVVSVCIARDLGSLSAVPWVQKERQNCSRRHHRPSRMLRGSPNYGTPIRSRPCVTTYATTGVIGYVNILLARNCVR